MAKQLQLFSVFLGGSDRDPPKEFCLFRFGENDTLKGTFILTRPGAEEVMARYREHGVDLMLDYEHDSLNPDAGPEQRKASGWGQLELRADGLYLANIKWTPKATEYLRRAEYRYLSPAFNVNDENEIIEVINVALTNLPATHDQPALVAANRRTLTKETPVKKKMKEHLSAALANHGGEEGLSRLLGMTKERLSACLSGGKMTQEEMKSCSTKLGLSEHDLEEEEAPIDASMNGIDVDKSKGNPGDDTMAHLAGLFETSGGEAHVPTEGGEASEDQSGALSLSRLTNEAILKLAGTTDPKKLGEVIVALRAQSARNADAAKTLKGIQDQVETARREQLITASKAKLNPSLIALGRRMPLKDMKEFFDALPAPVELHEPQPQGGNRMVALTREDKEVAKLSGQSETDFATVKASIGADERMIALAGNVGRNPDKAPKSDWDRRYTEHVQRLSLTGVGIDGKAWKPAIGSTLVTAGGQRTTGSL